jgi:hypothetical protein
MRKFLYLALVPMFFACQSTVTDQSQSISFQVSNDMLFSGPNSLQGEGTLDLVTLAENIGAQSENIKMITVSEAKIGMAPSGQAITESLLLQIVSNKNDLKTVGTLSPVPAEGNLQLNLAQDMDLLPYLKDEGMAWVLDLNLTEDHMDMMRAKGEVKLNIEYTESK